MSLSTIRVHKLTVLAKNEIVRRLGELAGADMDLLTKVLRRTFSWDQPQQSVTVQGRIIQTHVSGSAAPKPLT